MLNNLLQQLFQRSLPLRADICSLESLSRIALSKSKNRRRRQVVLPQSKRVASLGSQSGSSSGSILHLSEMWRRPFLSWKAIGTILHGEIFDQVTLITAYWLHIIYYRPLIVVLQCQSCFSYNSGPARCSQ